MANDVVRSDSFKTGLSIRRVHSDAISKRKTPSELRAEQRRRRRNKITTTNSQLSSLLSSERLNFEESHVLKKTEPLKTPNYIDTKVNVIFPVTKFGNRQTVRFGHEKLKDDYDSQLQQPSASTEQSEKIKCYSRGDIADEPNILESLAPVFRSSNAHVFSKADKSSYNTFKSVTNLSLGDKKSNCYSNIDMEKALKSLVYCETPVALGSTSPGASNMKSSSSQILPTELPILNNTVPFDFTLKTSLRLVSSSSVKWFQKILSGVHFDAATLFGSDCIRNAQNPCCVPAMTETSDVLLHKALHSWSYPQSFLPSSIVSMLSLSSSRADKDFFEKRQQDWEDSFTNLYYMLRKNICGIFYVCTKHFVALFIGGNFEGIKGYSCNAYLSQSTRGLRSLLSEHAICYSMPLCHSEQEKVDTEDLIEFMEIEKSSLGQTLRIDSSSDVDNTPQSLLAFVGDNNVHALFDFLLNYRFFIISLANFDVPKLLAPIAFKYASSSLPKVICKEMKKADFGSDAVTMSDTVLPNSVCHSIEIRDETLPPWIISRFCSVMISRGTNFESCFTPDSNSVGLNVALSSFSTKSDSSSVVSEIEHNKENTTFGIPHTIILPELNSHYLSGLRYMNGSCHAYTSSM
ncbi:hypothetical protein ZOSMA_59G00230 [Zostera marina]|uniref:Donson n=1 Tax=Zostera marina TaxID=29655 RepID=A0A0K9NV03_ZOSMR|nr:hypothetical protein ZOSMA_59G00230 [Zostera marina]